MFKYSLINQEKLTKQIISDIDNKLFSNSIIISGKKYSGKMTLAVELASYLTNSDYKRISDTNTIILSNRDTAIRLKALYNIAQEEQTHTSFYALLQEIYRTLHGYSPIFNLSKTEEQLYSIAADLNEELISFASELSVETLTKIEKPLKSLIAKYKGGFSIDQIRAIGAYMYSNSEKKVIILDGIEYAGISAINSLLKILEEPDKNTYFILLTSNYNQIIDTIKSRVRRYECSSTVLTDIKSKYLTYSGLDTKRLAEIAKEFLAKEKSETSKLNIINEIIALDPNLDIFITNLIQEIKLSDNSYKKMKKLNSIYNNSMIYNQNKATMLDLLMRELC